MTTRKKIVSLFLFAGFFSLSAAAPIRVGIFKGVGTNGYWHPSIHPGSAAVAAMLADPAQAGLENPIIPARGFAVTLYGADSSCSQNGCVPSARQLTTFINALDSLDAVIFPNNVAIGNAIMDPVQRQRLASYWMRKGVVSLHWSTYSTGTWAPWDSLHGTRFQQWQFNGNGTVHLDAAGLSPQRPSSWRFLNRGLPDTASFGEEWISFAHSGATIRSTPSLVPTVNIDENSYAGGNHAGAFDMGDHPISWYREFPQGGRFFYTGMGDRTATYTSTYFFRRQLYNAILWAAGADSNGVVASSRPARRGGAEASLKTWVSGSRIHVRVREETPWRVDLHALDGRLISSLRGRGNREVTFGGLETRAVYLVSVTTPRGRESRRVLMD